MFVGDGFIVVVRHGEASPLRDVRRRIEHRPDLVACGPATIAYAIVDKVVDNYGPVINGIENDIREVEFEVFSEADVNPVKRIYLLKREVLEFHRRRSPLVEPVEHLVDRARTASSPTSSRKYFRDVHDHLLRVCEQVQTFRDLLDERPRGEPHPGECPPERGHAEDLGVGGDRRHPDGRRRHLRDELRDMPASVGVRVSRSCSVSPPIVCALLYRAFRRSGWL